MVQPEFITPLIDTHDPTDSWNYTYESPEGNARFDASIVAVAANEFAAYIHIYADDGDVWNISGATGGGGVDEIQRLWFDCFQVADTHIRQTFDRVISGWRQ